MGNGETPITQVYMPPRAAILRLVEAGLVRGLDAARLDALRAECWDGDEEQMEEAGVLGILTSFYETVEKGMRDGFLWHDDRFWMETSDAVAEVAGMLHDDRPLFRQIAIVEKISTARRFRETVQAIELERDDGVRKTIEARTLDDVIACFNEELRARGRQRRIVALDTSEGWKMYVAIELRMARKLVAEGALPIASLDALRD
ncbi:MAG TPA: hypothetical protein VN947_09640 [Polyangia bacterium]|nr:hypothetical protein [Polyangia bacterium]